MTSVALAAPASPYKGLAAFDDTELDAMLFFGREGETEVIAANLLSSRLTVLYGPAGVGKSSILRAGVARRVRELAPDGLVVVHDSWAGDSVGNLWDAVAAALPGAELPESGTPLADRLEELVDAFGGHLYLIFDQFEEVFTYGGAVALADELSEVLTRPRLRVSVLLALREDTLSELDVFAGRVPDVFANRLGLDRLDRNAGRAATIGPVARLNDLSPEQSIELEPELVEAVLEEVEIGRVVLGGVARGTADALGEGGIEAPYLQLVMQRVWEVERARGSTVLRRATLEELGGAQAIVHAHLDRAVAALAPAERDVAARIFNHLVTPSGAKVAHSVGDLTQYAGIREDALRPVLASLGSDRILRPLDGRFEIFHDVLADAVLAWRTRHEAERAAERQRAAAHRRQRRLVGLLAVALAGLAAMAALALYALTQRDDARDQARRATARRLEAQAGPLIPVATAEVDPELGLLLAAEAARRSPTPEGLDILRRALLVSHLRAVLPERGVTAAAFAGRRVVVGTAAGSVSIYTAGGKRVRRLALGSPVAGIEAAAGGGKILTTRSGGPAQLWDVRSGRELERFGGAPTLAVFSPGGTLVATAEGRTVRVWRTDGDELAALSQDDPIRHVAWGSNGMSVVIAGTGSLARVIDAQLRLVAEVDQGAVVTSAVITPDGRTLVTTGRNGTARLWSLRRRGRLVGELAGHRGQVTAGVLSPDGRLLVTTSTDGTGRVWDVRSGSLVTDLIGHTNRVLGAAFGPDGSSVATWSTDRTVRVWDPERGRALAALPGHGDAVTAASFSASGDAVLTTSADGRARLWRPFDNRLRRVADLGGPLATASLSRDARVAAVAVEDGVAILDAATGRRVARLETGRVDGLGVSADGGRVAVAAGRAVTVWGVESGAVERTLEAGERVTSVGLAADGQAVAAGTAGGSVLLSGAAGEVVRMRGPLARVTSLAFSPSGEQIAAGFQSGAVAVWRAGDSRSVYERRHHRPGSAVTSVAFSSAGRRLVTAGGDAQVIVWDAASGSVSQRLRGHFGPVAGAAFSPDGRWVVTAAPGVAGLFDLMNRQRLLYVDGHSGRVLAASFDALGRRIAPIGADGTLRAYACDVCGGVPELLRLAERRLAGTGRMLSRAERRRYFLDR